MSKIAKVAVYDGRLQQDEPAYAVQKGALSVSVAPFSAISATATQMTFQVLVPSLNVFVDRKLQLSTPLSFTASLFWGGPRAKAASNVWAFRADANCVVGATTLSGQWYKNGTSTAAVAAPDGLLLFGGNTANTAVINCPFRSGTVTAAGGTGTSLKIFPGFQFVTANNITVYVFEPIQFNVPDPVTSVRAAAESLIGSNAAEPNAPIGYATAVSGEDLSFVQFPIQSALNNMTATLNDCTVTTNGDTLREQIMLTSNRANIKQRTTPSKADQYAWGRDDVSNITSGNFSSYSTADMYGDIPNGAWPTVWYADTQNTKPLLAAGTILAGGAGTVSTYPFVAPNTVFQFIGTSNASLMAPGIGANGGIGFYSATSTSVVSSGQVVVPFVNGQPVWTTGFPGGDLITGYDVFGAATAGPAAP
jgi:hypothetical protein